MKNDIDNEIKIFVGNRVNKSFFNNQDLKTLFDLYNRKFNEKESNTSCSMCVTRVWNRLLNYYKEMEK